MTPSDFIPADPGTARSWASLFPLVHEWYFQGLVVAGGYVLTMLLSGLIVRAVVGSAPDLSAPGTPRMRDAGLIIGKCENFLVLTMVLLGEYSGLGLVLAAKSIARLDAMKQNPSYYLGGTLVNLVWSTIMGLAVRTLVIGA